VNKNKNIDLERIEALIESLMKVAQGDYSVQMNLSEKNDHLDAIAVGFNMMVDDIKESKLIELENEKIKLLNRELEMSKLSAEENNSLKSVFISNLSHEIRTPMNGIIGFANLLNDSCLTEEERQEYTSIIINSSNQLLRIIDDIIAISRLESKQEKVFTEKVCINHLLSELHSIFRLKTEENEITLYLRKDLPDEDSVILTDGSKLSKILSNLLDNAMKYTPSGYIEFGYKLLDESLEFFVADTGLGIDIEQQEKIFERFTQEENKIFRSRNGLGLGLSIAKENAELLGGNIRVSSQSGKGTTFYVKIPYIKNHEFRKNKKAIKKPDEKTLPKSNPTILIAEDEFINYLYLKTIISEFFGSECLIMRSKDGPETILKCRETANPVDLVFMDIKMPGMDGFEVTRMLKETHPEIKIVMQSAYATMEYKEIAERAGCDDYIVKPIQKDALNEILFKFLNKNQLN